MVATESEMGIKVKVLSKWDGPILIHICVINVKSCKKQWNYRNSQMGKYFSYSWHQKYSYNIERDHLHLVSFIICPKLWYCPGSRIAARKAESTFGNCLWLQGWKKVFITFILYIVRIVSSLISPQLYINYQASSAYPLHTSSCYRCGIKP